MTDRPRPDIPPVTDLRDHPDWAPVRGTLHVGTWEVATWEEPRLPGDIGQDATLVAALGPTLRLAVMDAAENKNSDGSLSRALRATHTARGYLRTVLSLDAALSSISAELCDPPRRPRQRNPLVTVAAVDLDRRTGDGYAVRAGDCEVWVLGAGGWTAVFPSDMLTEEAREAWKTARASNPNASARQQWAEQEALLDDPSSWRCAPLGLVADPVPQVARLTGVREIIVTTDGSRLDAAKCSQLGAYLSTNIQVAVPGPVRHVSPHGDLAVLHASRRPKCPTWAAGHFG